MNEGTKYVHEPPPPPAPPDPDPDPPFPPFPLTENIIVEERPMLSKSCDLVCPFESTLNHLPFYVPKKSMLLKTVLPKFIFLSFSKDFSFQI